jgi:hypothetical protein
MCTRPAPTHRSISASGTALGAAIVNAFVAAVLLVIALTIAPFRLFSRLAGVARPSRLVDVDVQVHLGDSACVAELEAIVWKTLVRARQTWAPLPLPLDCVVVGAGFPPGGRADIYEDFLDASGAKKGRQRAGRRRVVVSLGVRDGTRDLDGWEIAGALAAQIQILVDDQCRQHRSLAIPAAVVQTTSRLTPATVAATDSSASGEKQPDKPRVPTNGPSLDASSTDEVPRVADLLVHMQKDPLGSGSSQNGTHV